MKRLMNKTEKINAIRPPDKHDDPIFWEEEVNLGYFSKTSPVLIEFVVK